MTYSEVLVDGDIILNKAGYAAEIVHYEAFTESEKKLFKYKREANEYLKGKKGGIVKIKETMPLALAYKMVDGLLNTIKRELLCDNLRIIVGSSSPTFRHQLDDTYKANRNPEDKPILLTQLKEYVINKYGAVTTEVGLETDDVLGIEQCRKSGTIIASIDKDLLQIPGHHYNLDTKEVIQSTDPGLLYQVRQKNKKKLCGFGQIWFFAQMLLGDPVDNIKGIKGLGDVKVFGILKDVKTSKQAFKIVRGLYRKHKRMDDFDKNIKLLWIMRK